MGRGARSLCSAMVDVGNQAAAGERDYLWGGGDEKDLVDEPG